MSWDFSELSNFEQDLLSLAQELNNGKEAKKLLRKSGTKLRNRTLKIAKARIKKRTGDLFKGIKRGRPYKYAPENSFAVRVYGGSPAYHIHLLNDGHRIVDKNGKEHGFKKGYRFMEDGLKEYEDEFQKDTEDFIDDLLDNHLL